MKTRIKAKLNPILILGGVASLAYGIFHLFVSEYRDYQYWYHVDLGENQYYWAATEIAFSLFLFWLAWYKRFDRKETHVICPQCESVFSKWEFKDGRCPHDKAELEPMNGYYERHPERKDAPIKPNMD